MIITCHNSVTWPINEIDDSSWFFRNRNFSNFDGFLKNHEESSILLIGHVTELWQVIIIEIAVYLSSGKNNHFYLSMDIFPTFIKSDFHTNANIFAMKHIEVNTL